jgi:hypothetical protein
MQKTFTIDNSNDIAESRKAARDLLIELRAPISEQSRLSWLVDHLGRQILLYGGHNDLILSSVLSQDGERNGFQINCGGAWLRPLGRLYQSHLVSPSLTYRDIVTYNEGHDPTLTIITWITEPTTEENS